MDAEIAALAAVAAQELVRSMTGQGWTLLRNGIAELLGRGDEERAGRHAALLETSRQEVHHEPDHGAVVGGRWEGRLGALLEEHPELAPELRRLVDEARRENTAGGNDTIVGTVTVAPAHGSIGAVRIGNATVNTGFRHSGS